VGEKFLRVESRRLLAKTRGHKLKERPGNSQGALFISLRYRSKAMMASPDQAFIAITIPVYA
jgi:hypothetical protein